MQDVTQYDIYNWPLIIYLDHLTCCHVKENLIFATKYFFAIEKLSSLLPFLNLDLTSIIFYVKILIKITQR